MTMMKEIRSKRKLKNTSDKVKSLPTVISGTGQIDFRKRNDTEILIETTHTHVCVCLVLLAPMMNVYPWFNAQSSINDACCQYTHTTVQINKHQHTITMKYKRMHVCTVTVLTRVRVCVL